MGCMPLRAMLAAIASKSLFASQLMPHAMRISGFSSPNTYIKQQSKSAHEVEKHLTGSGSRTCRSSC